MKIKTSELIDSALDWAVWTASGGAAAYPKTASGKAFLKLWLRNSAKYIHPSTDWSQGGPIIEREGLTIGKVVSSHNEWSAESFQDDGIRVRHLRYGPTPLIAAMRCYCASRLGEEAEVPEELV
jgi:hypothetical protein